MKHLLKPVLSAVVLSSTLTAFSADITPDTLRLNNIFISPLATFRSPLMIDSTDVNAGKLDMKRVLKLNASRKSKAAIPYATGAVLPVPGDSLAVGIVTLEAEFNVNTFLPDAVLAIENGGNYKAYIDGKEVSGPVSLEPGTHKISVDVMTKAGDAVAPSVAVCAKDINSKVSDVVNGKRRPTLSDFSDGKRIVGVALSPDGSMLQTHYTNTLPGGATERYYSISSTAADRKTIISRRDDGARWMPVSNKLYFARQGAKGRELVSLDPVSGNEEIIVSSVPAGSVAISPTEDFAIITEYQAGPKEGDVYQILEPEDRQPGWRTRGTLLKQNFSDGMVEQLTFGNANTWLMDIADDGSKILLATRRSRLDKRPTSLVTVISLDLNSMKADTIVGGDGFVASAVFSPDGKQILLAGNPEALGGVGINVPEGRIPSMTETELFLIDAENPASITPLTKYFDPSVNNYDWSRADGLIYVTAEDRDYYHLYTINPKTGDIRQLEEPEDLVKSMSLPRNGSLLAWSGQGASNPDRLYLTDLKKKRNILIEEPSAERLADVDIVKCSEWSFDNGRGDTIYCRYYLPADFDPDKKYPLIVNYYGGCSPTSRNFESRYPHNLYAAQGYGVLVIVPSGATGRGQEFASRHVNTAGQGVADDIIAGTKQFCAENPWVDASRIGCIGASYGGFMTQYLQTVTDIFAAAISHAGISDHTSYWGEGYWGYSYSEVSMADSYPWTRKDLYVDQSPLFRADKVNTPLLFLHGDSDNNVPVGESIQMFTALKLLGKETAFVAVADQDHHILDYDKRKKWQNTIFAWFEKYLKNDSSWWDALYPPKTL